jgi:hypothetical protein
MAVTGAPIMMSFPHFYLGDPSLLETVQGLKPDPKKHDGYLDVHEASSVSHLFVGSGHAIYVLTVSSHP